MRFNREEILNWKSKISIAAWEYALLWTLLWITMIISIIGVFTPI